MSMEPPSGEVRVLWSHTEVVTMQYCNYRKCRRTVPFKWLPLCSVNFTSIFLM